MPITESTAPLTAEEEISKFVHRSAKDTIASFRSAVATGLADGLNKFGANTVIAAYDLAIKERNEARSAFFEIQRHGREGGAGISRIATKIANSLIFPQGREFVSVASVFPLATAYLCATTELDEARRASRPEDLDIIKEQSDVLLQYSAKIEKLEAALGRNGTSSTDERLAALEATAEDLRARQLAAEDHIADLAAERKVDTRVSPFPPSGLAPGQINALGEIIEPLIWGRTKPTTPDDNPTKH